MVIMSRYTNKFVEFLNGGNTIAISGVKDFNSLNSLCKKVGLDCITDNYWNLLHLAQINNCAINNITVLVEYQPYKGLTFGYKTIEDSEKWYEKKPWKMSEVVKSMQLQ